MRAERPPQLLVPALADEVQIELAEGGQEAVRVVQLQLGVLVRHQQPVLRDLPQRQHPGEQPVPLGPQPGAQPGGRDGHRAGVRAQAAEEHTTAHGVGAEQVVRCVVRPGQQPPPLLVHERGRGPDPVLVVRLVSLPAAPGHGPPGDARRLGRAVGLACRAWSARGARGTGAAP
ncbi:hypothetical protein SANTM175S_02504 [Streptomyces antimycoticus]